MARAFSSFRESPRISTSFRRDLELSPRGGPRYRWAGEQHQQEGRGRRKGKSKSNRAMTKTSRKKRALSYEDASQQQPTDADIILQILERPREKCWSAKDRARLHTAAFIAHLGDTFQRGPSWVGLNEESFEDADEETPIEKVEFNEVTRRYEVNERANESTRAGTAEHDATAQAMVMILLYRMHKGWGQPRFLQSLSVWTGKPATDDDHGDPFPLPNMWAKDIDAYIKEKKLGKTTLSHQDNFDNFPRLYGCSTSRWSRRSNSYISTVHTLAEQSAIQMALELPGFENYATLAAQIIHYALQEDDNEGPRVEERLMSHLALSLFRSSRKQTDCFAKMALEDIEKHDWM